MQGEPLKNKATRDSRTAHNDYEKLAHNEQ